MVAVFGAHHSLRQRDAETLLGLLNDQPENLAKSQGGNHAFSLVWS